MASQTYQIIIFIAIIQNNSEINEFLHFWANVVHLIIFCWWNPVIPWKHIKVCIGIYFVCRNKNTDAFDIRNSSEIRIESPPLKCGLLTFFLLSSFIRLAASAFPRLVIRKNDYYCIFIHMYIYFIQYEFFPIINSADISKNCFYSIHENIHYVYIRICDIYSTRLVWNFIRNAFVHINFDDRNEIIINWKSLPKV